MCLLCVDGRGGLQVFHNRLNVIEIIQNVQKLELLAELLVHVITKTT